MNGSLKKSALASVLAGALCMVAGEAAALGFGTPSSRTLLGAPLRVSMPLHFSSSSDEVGDECLMADVYFGDVKVAQEQVSAIVKHVSDTEFALLIGTSVPVNEPVVTVNLSYGCTTKYSRQIVVLADPPLDAPSVPVTAPVAGDAMDLSKAPSGMPMVGHAVTIPPATVEPPVQRPVRHRAEPKVAPKPKPAGAHLTLDRVDAQPLDPQALGRSVPMSSTASAVVVAASAPSQVEAPLQLRMTQDQQRMDEMEKRIASLNAEVAALKARPSGNDRAIGLLAALAFLAIVTSGVLFMQWRREKQTRELLQS